MDSIQVFDFSNLFPGDIGLTGPEPYVDSARIRADLTRRAPEVAQALLPEGRRDGGAWIAPSPFTPGAQLRVIVEGAEAGRWQDGEEPLHGDLLDLATTLNLARWDAKAETDADAQAHWQDAREEAMYDALARGWSGVSVYWGEEAPAPANVPPALPAALPYSPDTRATDAQTDAEQDVRLDMMARLAGRNAHHIAADRVPSGVTVAGVFSARLGDERLELEVEGAGSGNWRLWPSSRSGDILDLLVLLEEVPSREDAAHLALGEGWISLPPEEPAAEPTTTLAQLMSGISHTRSALPLLLMGRDIAALPPFEWLVQGVVPRGGLACMSGIPGLAKSFVAIHLGLSVATGQPFFGRQVEQGRVLYITPEGRRGLKKRKAAWEREFNGGAVVNENFILLPCALPFDLIGTKDQPALLAHIGGLLDENIRVYGPVSILIVDTLAACMTGSENDNDAMMRFVRGLSQLTEALGAGALLLHHPPKSGEDAEGANFFRGSGALMGALDVGLSLRRDKATNSIVLSPAEKMKDDEAAPPLAFTLRVVDLGSTDNFGRPMTSCVLEPCAVPAKAGGGRAGKKPTKIELIRPQLERLLDEAGPLKIADMLRKLSLDGEGQKARNWVEKALKAMAAEGLAACEGGFWRLTV